MRFRFLVFLSLCVISAIILSYGCSDKKKSGGGGVIPKEEMIEKIVWQQQMPSDFSLGDDAGEANAQDKLDGLFTAKLDGEGLSLLSPKMSGTPLSLGTAPNGDEWFLSEYGIMKTSVESKDPNPKLLMSSQRLATSFYEDANVNEGYFYAPFIQRNFNVWHNSIIDFVSLGDGKYRVLMLNFVLFRKEDRAFDETAYLWLNCDSEMKECKKILPYRNKTDDGRHRLVLNDAGDTLRFTGFYFYDPEVRLMFFDATLDINGKASLLAVAYDPIKGEHLGVIVKDDKYEVIDYYAPDRCLLFQKVMDIPFAAVDCNFDFQVDDRNEDLMRAREKVISCMQEKIEDEEISIYCIAPKDITEYFKSKEEIIRLGSIENVNDFDVQPIAKVNASHTKKFQVLNVICENNKCGPTLSTVRDLLGGDCRQNINDCPKRHLDVPFPAKGSPNSPYLFFMTRNGADKDQLNYLNLKEDKLYVVDKDDPQTQKHVNNFYVSHTDGGDLLLYKKDNMADRKSAYFLYDPERKISFQLTNYYENYFIAGIDCLVKDYNEFCTSVTPDRKGAFFYNDELGSHFVDLEWVFKKDSEEGGPKQDSIKESYPGAKDRQMVIVGYTKGKAIWSDENDTLQLFVNKPFDEDNDIKKLAKVSDLDSPQRYSGIAAYLEKKVDLKPSLVPPNKLAETYACGGEDKDATYCPESKKMCVNGVCLDMYSCSERIPIGICDVQGEACVNGVCVAGPEEECVQDADCGEGSVCLNGVCREEPERGQDCNRDEDCPAAMLCIDRSCMEPIACNDDQDCGQFVCINGFCAEPPEPECSSHRDCQDNERCIAGACVGAVCVPACAADELCRHGECLFQCNQNLDCGVKGSCFNGGCREDNRRDCNVGNDCLEKYCEDHNDQQPGVQCELPANTGFECIEYNNNQRSVCMPKLNFLIPRWSRPEDPQQIPGGVRYDNINLRAAFDTPMDVFHPWFNVYRCRISFTNGDANEVLLEKDSSIMNYDGVNKNGCAFWGDDISLIFTDNNRRIPITITAWPIYRNVNLNINDIDAQKRFVIPRPEED